MQMPAWTYSLLDKFETCPKQYYHLKVVKDVVDTPHVANEWGNRVHTALEYRIRDGTPLPEGMTQWEGIAGKLEAIPGVKYCEQRMAIDENFQPTDWKQAWSRGMADLNIVSGSTGLSLDYKTGKRKPSEQLMLYAGYMFAYYPQLTQVDTGFVWLKDKKIDKQRFTRDQVPAIWQEFLPRYHRLLRAYERDAWPPNPSGLCNGWCPVKSCQFYKPKR